MKFIALFAVVFLATYGAASWWTTAHYETLPAWNLPFESRVPFVPEASVLYLTLTPVLLLSPLILKRDIGPFAIVLSMQAVIAALFFLVIPQTVAWTRPEVTGWARLPFTLADALNLQYNQFPSLHVAFAISAAWAYRKWGWWLWAIAIAASTWLMWEHNLADISGGVVLAMVTMRFAYRSVEVICLEQCLHFASRHVRYFVIFLAIYLPSLLHWRRYRAVRTGFCAAQWIDDLLDGDRPSDREPLEVVDHPPEALQRLIDAFFAEVDADAQGEFKELVQCMRIDRIRVLEQARWTEEQLDAHHCKTFTLSVDLLLIASRCTARAREVPSLIESLAWCSVYRDLDEDLRKGLDNIPLGAEAEEWLRTSHARACESLQRSANEIAQLEDPRARRILGIFQKSVEKYARKELVTPRGFEPPTKSLGNSCSIRAELRGPVRGSPPR